MSARWDVVVVGGGPAGSATAARLASRGHGVLLLDRERFPRVKPCGECLNPAAVEALKELGVRDRVAGAGRPIRGWRIHPPGAEPFSGSFPGQREGLAVPRAVLDDILLEHARASGAEVRLGARVVDLLRAEGGRVTGVRLAGGEEAGATLVVGADGLRSVVVRRLGLIRRPPRLRKLALTAHVEGVEGLTGRGELHVRAWGCLGAAEVAGGRANVTVVVGQERAVEVAGGREAFFDGVLRSEPRFAGARRLGGVLATGPFDWPTRGAVADGALLVGDAAGYFDPFTGQGISRALRGAALAADAADAALGAADGGAAALAGYQRACAVFTPGLRLQHIIEHFVARPAWLRAAAARLRRHPALADALVGVTGDVLPVCSLLRPGLLARALW